MSKQTDLLNLTDAITVSGSSVGIGTSSPDQSLTVGAGGKVRLYRGDNTRYGDIYADNNFLNIETSNDPIKIDGQSYIRLDTNSSEAMRISGGNLLVGKTSTSSTTAGAEIFGAGYQFLTNNGVSLYLTRPSIDGEMLRFLKGTTTVGSISTLGGDLAIGSPTGSGAGLRMAGSSNIIYASNASGNARDNAIDLGASNVRFDDIYATNGTIQTSDRNEKQDIEALSDAEQRVAQACKGLLRKFRWIDAVAEKGDDARIHFGIIAQDLQDAFAAEGLDAGRYAMFISSTWWETQTEVPAVEADEENGIEAKEAYTRTDTYETLEESPEGATERTRLGVRYPELLAFIIGAM